eukprot:PRCOL_00003275-RA
MRRADEAKAAGVGAAGASGDGEWSWSLNWDQVDEKITVGSCPRSPADIDELADATGASAILNLQSDDCFEAMGIDFEGLREHAECRDMVLVRVPQRDFDKGDQALMLPETVRVLASLIEEGHHVYVHCTAGINRATLATLGYLTFSQGWVLEDALERVRGRRPQANPYVESWHTARGLMTSGRDEELKARARSIYEHRKANGGDKSNRDDDWGAAERQMIQEQFARRLQIDMGRMRAYARSLTPPGSSSRSSRRNSPV